MPPPIIYTSAVVHWQRPDGTWLQQQVPASARAQLTPTNMNGGSAPLATILPPGWGTGGCPMHHQRGHLVGQALGGPGNDPQNLVTLVAGTNHPFMYDYEAAVKTFVQAEPGRAPFTYTVSCSYDQPSYTATPGFPYYGAAGNPFCLWPAPVMLLLSLIDVFGTPVDVAELFPLWTPAQEATFRSNMMIGGAIVILNGIYKNYTGAVHTANGCWAVTHNPALLLPAAAACAHSLNHLP